MPNEVKEETRKWKKFLREVSVNSFSLIWKIMPYVLLGVAI